MEEASLVESEPFGGAVLFVVRKWLPCDPQSSRTRTFAVRQRIYSTIPTKIHLLLLSWIFCSGSLGVTLFRPFRCFGPVKPAVPFQEHRDYLYYLHHDRVHIVLPKTV